MKKIKKAIFLSMILIPTSINAQTMQGNIFDNKNKENIQKTENNQENKSILEENNLSKRSAINEACYKTLIEYRKIINSFGTKYTDPDQALISINQKNNTLQRLLNIAWMLNCEVTQFLNEEIKRIEREM